MLRDADGSRRHGLTPVRRWLLVLSGVSLLVATPIALRSLPVRDSAVPAGVLLSRVQHSAGVGYSGYAEVVGNMQLPVTDRFSGLATLLGGTSDLRVWWRATDNWRVDSITPTGESDLIRNGSQMTSWRYESSRVVRSLVPDFRLPQSSDIVPAALGHRLLQDASPRDVTRIPSIRVAGHDAAGLRLRPADRRSTVDHVDVWADERTGLALRVAVFGNLSSTPLLTSAFISVDIRLPGPSTTAFRAPRSARVSFDEAIDIGSAADQFAPVTPPIRLIGLPRLPHHVGAVGEYGSGVTVLVAIPLWPEAASELQDQLARTPGSRESTAGLMVGVGPVNVLLTPDRFGRGRWLVLGTVKRSALRLAGHELTTADR